MDNDEQEMKDEKILDIEGKCTKESLQHHTSSGLVATNYGEKHVNPTDT